MKQILICVSIFMLMEVVQAELLIQSKDWVAEKDIMTPLGKMGCVAQTTTEVMGTNGVKENWTLQVIKLQSPNGDYAYPMVISFPEQQVAAQYYEGTGQTDKINSTIFEMTLLQPNEVNKTILATRLKDRLEVVRNLRRDSTFRISYLDKSGPVQTALFSLKGSSNAIKTMVETCR